MTMTVLVTGARGKTGRELVKTLADTDGVEVRGGGRAPGAIAVDGATAVRFDWGDEATWRPALDGVDALYLVKPKAEDVAARVARLLDGGRHLQRVVLLSEIHAEHQDETATERHVERVVEQGPVSWTILRPNWFMQDLVDEQFFLPAIRDEGRLVHSTDGQAISWIDARDIADVAAAALLEDEHGGQAYTLTGGDPVTGDELAGRIARAAGRSVEHVDPSLDEIVRARADAGAPPSAVAYARRIHGNIHSGAAAQVTDAVRRVTGRDPRTLADFIEQFAGAWRR